MPQAKRVPLTDGSILRPWVELFSSGGQALQHSLTWSKIDVAKWASLCKIVGNIVRPIVIQLRR